MNKRPDKKDVSDKALRIVFSVLLILCAVGLFLISDAGRRLLAGVFGGGTAKAAASAPQVSPSATAAAKSTAAPYPLVEDFIARAAENGAPGTYKLIEESKSSRAYTIEREDMGDARLLLSLTEGRVVAFALEWTVAAMPEPPGEDPSAIEKDLYELRRARYERDCLWLEEAFPALADALDAGDSIPYASFSVLYEISKETLRDGKRRAQTLGGFGFTAFLNAGEGGGVLSLVFAAK